MREAKDEDNERYRNFLRYMEEKREEARQQLLEEKDRKKDGGELGTDE